MNKLDVTCFQIISNVGSAKSMYMQAIQLAKNNKIQEAKDKVLEGEQIFNEGHKVHHNLITMMANGEKIDIDLLLLHAEDQLINTEMFNLVTKEIIELYERLTKNNI